VCASLPASPRGYDTLLRLADDRQGYTSVIQ
jgi:hypothetical protein